MLYEINHVHIHDLGPALHGHLAVLRVDAHLDAVAVLCEGLQQKAFIRYSLGAENDPADAGFHVTIDGFHGADAAADFYFKAGLPADSCHHVEIAGTAVPCAFQVHHMEHLCACGLDGLCHLHRVIGIDRHLVILTPEQPDHLLVI